MIVLSTEMVRVVEVECGDFVLGRAVIVLVT